VPLHQKGQGGEIPWKKKAVGKGGSGENGASKTRPPAKRNLIMESISAKSERATMQNPQNGGLAGFHMTKGTGAFIAPKHGTPARQKWDECVVASLWCKNQKSRSGP